MRSEVNDLHDLLKAAVGARISGGCQYCDAYQTVRLVGGGAVITVHHDDWCPMHPRHTRTAKL